MTRNELGVRFGVSAQQIYKYEKGISRISVVALYQMSQVFAVNLQYFLEDFMYNHALSVAEDNDIQYEVKSNDDQIKLLQLFEKIHDKKIKAQVVNLIEMLVGED